MTDEPTTAVAPTYESRMSNFNQKWERALPIVRQLLPAHLTPERVYSVAITAMQRNPRLAECSEVSIIRGILIGASLGLDVGGVGGKSWLIPYRVNGKMEAQFQIGYRGLIELALRSGRIVGIYGRAVYEGDHFEYQDGMVQHIVHRPIMEPDAGKQGKVTGAWAVAVFANSFRQAEFMNRIQLDQVRGASKAADDGPWNKWYAEMAIKTVIKRLLKKLPDSVELQTVVDIEDSAEAGVRPTSLPSSFDALDAEVVEPPPTRTEAIREEVKKRGPGRPPKPKEEPPAPAPTLPEPPAGEQPADYDDSYDAD